MVQDQDIRRAIAEIAAQADELPPAPDLGPRLSRTRRHLILRAAAVSVTLLLIAALGYWAVDALRGDQIVVIDDSPGKVAGPGPTDEADSAASREDQPLLETVREAIAFLEKGEIEILPYAGHPQYSEVPANPLGELRVYEAWLEGHEVVQITATLSQDSGPEEATRLWQEIESWPEVTSYSFVHSEQNRERVRQDMIQERRKTDPSFAAGEDWDFIGPRFPDLFEIRLAPGAQQAEGRDRLQGDPAVDAVEVTDGLRSEAMERNVRALLSFAEAGTAEAEEWLASAMKSPGYPTTAAPSSDRQWDGLPATPTISESGLMAAKKAVRDYFINVRIDRREAFSRLIAPTERDNASSLFDEERSRLRDAGEEAFAPKMLRPLVCAGDGYLVEPIAEVPDELKAWIRGDPRNRTAVQVAMLDGAVRTLRVERAADGTRWVIVP